MDEKQSKARLAIYISEFLVDGYVKLSPRMFGDQKSYPRRISDIILSASQRMAEVGEAGFLEVDNADIKDLRTNENLKGIKSLAINKSLIKIIYQVDT